ncbi:enoyl-CoA hydratase/isomerase family protein [bacterium]|nr:MAG: enoyl-CoA hydratase/isomerase family protein [bacterium]
MLKAEREGGVLRLTLDRPEVRNAFDEALIAALHEAFANVSADVRAVVLSGSGEAFCAGGDLNWMRRAADQTFEENEADALRLARMLAAVRDCSALTVARIHGACFGGGCGLAAAVDVAICADDAKFSFSEVRLGLIPATIAPFVLEKIGPGHARALFATAEVFDGAEAVRIGLARRSGPADGLDEAIEKILKGARANAPGAVSVAKRLAVAPPATLEDAARLLAERRATDEGREGIAAFLEKRKPEWAQ